MIPGFQGLPQNPSNQRPTMALLSCSRDMTDLLSAIKGQVHSEQVHLGSSRQLLCHSCCAARRAGTLRIWHSWHPAKFEHARGRSAMLITQRFSCGISRTRLANSATSSRDRFRWTRFVDAGCFARETPGHRSLTGRIGRGANPPPLLGQTLSSIFSTHSAQKVHS